MKRFLTGLQPTGCLTLGNYIGAIKQMVKYQEEFDSFIFIADMHAITIPKDPEKLRKDVRDLVAIYLACGIDPNKNTIFIQSENIYHANVSWILECNTPYGQLGRMTQFKDKSQKHENFMAGLLTYPILMAADILIYDTDCVPVGKDQKQHVELARDIAESFNKRFGKDFFKVPEPLIPEEGAKIGDLLDPTKKMSKSAENPKGVILLLDSEKDIRKKIMGATTDSEMCVRYDPENKPGISNLITIYHELSGLSVKEIEEKFKDANYGTFKTAVADCVVATLNPIRQRYEELINSEELDKILDAGRDKTLEIAKKKYEELKEIVGLKR
ncbi:MAG: tryptophan--tRNA ligase [Clostridia bacterium]|nr:tryptophan--tRNA ligase [Clostridia bacterium]